MLPSVPKHPPCPTLQMSCAATCHDWFYRPRLPTLPPSTSRLLLAHLLGRIWAINCDRTSSIFVKHRALMIVHVPFLSIASTPNSAVYLLGLSLRCSKKPFFPWSCTYKVNLRGNPYFRPRTTFKEIRGHWFKQILHMIQSSF